MKALILALLIVSGFLLPLNSQDVINQTNRKHIAIVNNNTSRTIKKLYAGDRVRLKLTNSSKIKGMIISIDSLHFNVSNRVVYFNEIMKISTKRGWVQGLEAD